MPSYRSRIPRLSKSSGAQETSVPSIAGQALLDRRRFLTRGGAGLGAIALAHLLGADGLLGRSPAPLAGSTQGPLRPEIDPSRPNAARKPHFRARARNVVVIFCSGALSHVDTFDWKPELERFHGKPMPGGEKLITFQGAQGNLTRSPWKFRPRGESGKMVSELVDHLGELADEMCFIHSMTSKSNSHGPGENFMSTGNILEGFPSAGAWVSYALGSTNDNLPAFVAIPDPRGVPQSSINNWGNGFLPAAFQGTAFNATKPLENLARPAGIGREKDRSARDLLRDLNEHHLARFPGDSELSARIASYELAARMQVSIPEVTDLSRETAATLRLYGADDSSNPIKAGYARNCILARRLVERGVRFVQLFNGAYQNGGEGVANWDGHKTIVEHYSIHGPILDQPTAAFLRDLRQRGLLEDTLVVFTTEFGRMPTFQKGASGRDHNPKGFTAWLVGAGVKAPFSYGATDEFGYQAVEKLASVWELWATVLHILGLDYDRLSYYHNGFERRLTDVHGHVLREILA